MNRIKAWDGVQKKQVSRGMQILLPCCIVLKHFFIFFLKLSVFVWHSPLESLNIPLSLTLSLSPFLLDLIIQSLSHLIILAYTLCRWSSLLIVSEGSLCFNRPRWCVMRRKEREQELWHLFRGS